MNFFINSGEKILPAQKLSIFTLKETMLFIGQKGSQKINKIKNKSRMQIHFFLNQTTKVNSYSN